MAVTLRQVAKEAGVSTAAVSRVLTGNRDNVFREVTRLRIHAVAERLGYRPNMAGRSLQMNRSFLLGVLINASNDAITNRFLRGVQAGLNGGDYSPIVFSHTDCDEQDKCLRRCGDRRVDGLILNASHDAHGQFDLKHFHSLAPPELPVVEVFGHFVPDVPSFNIDDAAVGRASTRHLLELGHRSIAMLTHERYVSGRGKRAGSHFDAWERYLGYEAAMQEAGLEPLVVTHPIAGEVDVSEQFVDGGLAALKVLLAHPARPTAVVCYNDLQAYGLALGAREAGFFLPERLSTVGFGDIGHARVMSPALTTVPVPAFDVGRQAALALLELIDARPVASALIDSELVVRKSTIEMRTH